MDMQDKNIDEIFRSRLDAFEVEPSAGVWPRIAGEISSTKRPASGISYLGVAATVIILLSAGIFFIPQKAKKRGEQRIVSNVAKTATNSAIAKSEHVLTGKINVTALKAASTAFRHNKKRNPVPAENSNPQIETPNLTKTDQPEIASVLQRQQEAITPAVPDITTQLTVKQSLIATTNFINKPGIVSAQLPAIGMENAEPIKPKHGIHRLGGLINAVVAKVDKRRDKIIEFTDD